MTFDPTVLLVLLLLLVLLFTAQNLLQLAKVSIHCLIKPVPGGACLARKRPYNIELNVSISITS